MTRLLPLLLLAACSLSEDLPPWHGWVYPDRHDLTESRDIGHYSSLADCRTAARSYLVGIGVGNRGDYECGRDCELQDIAAELYVCDETRR